jgi:AAA domain
MKMLPTIRAAHLAEPESSQAAWLIEGLWSNEAVGIIGGEPKCGKSFLALDLAVANCAMPLDARQPPHGYPGSARGRRSADPPMVIGSSPDRNLRFRFPSL